MKPRIFLFVHLVIFCRVCASAPIAEDFGKAQEIARAYDKPLVLIFTGSDWCPLSKTLVENVLQDLQFQEIATHSFVFVKIDFPDVNHQNTEIMEENYRLKETFCVKEFPMMIMLDPQGKEVTRLSYMPETPREYADHLLDLYLRYQSLSLEARDLAQIPVDKLESMYERARYMRCPHLIEAILEEGSKRQEGFFLPLERYSQLLYSGSGDEQEIENLRKQIVERDPGNRHGTLLRLALLDFQTADAKDSASAVQPLFDFIRDFGEKETSVLWQLHSVISEYFQSHGEPEKAQFHAKKSEELLASNANSRR